jgi:hypothetical protein
MGLVSRHNVAACTASDYFALALGQPLVCGNLTQPGVPAPGKIR